MIAPGERPSDFPLPQRGKFGRHARGSESTNRLGLAEIIGLTPTFQGDNDGRDRFLRWGGLVLLGKEPFQGRSCNGLRRGLPCFPSLQSPKLYWQPGCNQFPDDRFEA